MQGGSINSKFLLLHITHADRDPQHTTLIILVQLSRFCTAFNTPVTCGPLHFPRGKQIQKKILAKVDLLRSLPDSARRAENLVEHLGIRSFALETQRSRIPGTELQFPESNSLARPLVAGTLEGGKREKKR